MKHQICSDRKTVREFLVQMQAILTDPDFDIGSDIVIQRKKRKDDFLSSYTTEHTMLELGYDTNDVVEELKKTNDCRISRDNY